MSFRNSVLVAVGCVILAPNFSNAGERDLILGLIGAIAGGAQRNERPQSPESEYSQPFRLGDEAAEQRNFRMEIQRRLNLLGFSAGVPDGVFGPQTRSAIASFQRSIGRSATGALRQDEIAALYDSTNNQASIAKSAAPPRPMLQSHSPAPKNSEGLTEPLKIEPSVAATASRPTQSQEPEVAVGAASTSGKPVVISPSIPMPAN